MPGCCVNLTTITNEPDDMMSFWKGFFRDAGIIECDVEDFAVSFINHRIRKNMLPDLNKDYLSEMGITAMGDIIAILRQAKAVLKKPSYAAASSVQPPHTAMTSRLETCLIKLEQSIPESQLSSRDRRTVRLGPRSMPASKTVDHFLAGEPGARLLSDNMLQPFQDLKGPPEFESMSREYSVFGQLGYDAPYARDTSVRSCPALPDQSNDFQVMISRATANSSTSKAFDLREVRKRPATTPPCQYSDDYDSKELECRCAGVFRKLHVPGRKDKWLFHGNKSEGSVASSAYTEGMFDLNANETNWISVCPKHRLTRLRQDFST